MAAVLKNEVAVLLSGARVHECDTPHSNARGGLQGVNLVRHGGWSCEQPQDKIAARGFDERLEVAVPRKKRNISVDTALGDQRVT